MKIIQPTTTTDNEIRVDPTAPRVVFDPWPFMEEYVWTAKGAVAGYVNSDGTLTDDGDDVYHYTLSEYSNQLVQLTDGRWAVAPCNYDPKGDQ